MAEHDTSTCGPLPLVTQMVGGTKLNCNYLRYLSLLLQEFCISNLGIYKETRLDLFTYNRTLQFGSALLHTR